MRVRVPVLALTASLALACAQGIGSGGRIEFETGRRAAVTLDGLHRVRSTTVTNAFLRPGASFEGYDQLLIEPVQVFYQRNPRDPRAARGPRGNFALSPTQMERFRSTFQQAFETVLSESEVFRIVEQDAPNALRITAHIVDLVVKTPPEGTNPRHQVFTTITGAMTLILDVSDSQSLQPLGRIAERRIVEPAHGQVRRSGMEEWVEVRRIFRNWARVLREGLEELVTLGPVPEIGGHASEASD